jgi:molybdenum cofactor cytidylyltransferase
MKLAHALRLKTGDVVAFVGGGGKTTAMFQVATELAPEMRVLTTTSTRIFAAQVRRSPTHITFNPELQRVVDLLPSLEEALEQHGQALLTGPTDEDSGKAFGLPPEIIDELAASGKFDLIINEADGSRMRSFKAPAAHEPVIPASTTLVAPVVGLDVIDQPLDEATVHRAGLVSRLSNTPPGAPVTPATVASVLCHAEGGLKGVPAGARLTPILNKVDGRWPGGQAESVLAAGRETAGRLLRCDRIDTVLIGAVQDAASPVREVLGHTAAIVLAAGGSSRFGSPKQLARWGDQTLIERVTDAALASQAWPVMVVLGAQAEACRAVLGNRPVEIVVNTNWAEGQSTSMQAGLAALPAHVSAALFLLVDLPGITSRLIDRLIQRHRETLAPLVWPEFAGRRGNPVLFDGRLFPELMQVRGDTGGRPLVLAYQSMAERVAVTDSAILQDIDRTEDLSPSH